MATVQIPHASDLPLLVDGHKKLQLRGASLTAREARCLALLANGMTTRQVAEDLCISQSTIAKHLAAIRRKCEVSTTRQALVLFLQERAVSQSKTDTGPRANIPPITSNDRYSRFSSELDQSNGLDHSFELAADFVKDFGFTHSVFGFVAEPFGRITNGARLLGSSFPLDVMKLYEEAGGADADSVPRMIATQRQSRTIEPYRVVSMQSQQFPQLVKDFNRALLDLEVGKVLVVPGYDDATDAPYCLSLGMDFKNVVSWHRHRVDIIREIETVAMMLWESIRRKGLLAAESGLSAQHRDALRYCAWGYRSAVAAERMSLSTRSFEAVLHQAREVMGATTTAAAVYRAAAYGALKQTSN